MHRFYESKEIVDAYVKYRPPYPEKLVEQVMKYRGEDEMENKTYNLLLDVGCGSGQACSLFQPYFEKIVGIDISEEQIKQAIINNKHQNISYQIGCAEKISASDKSVDMVIAGIAAHWFDLPKFFEEVERVLKPNACLAMFSYVFSKIGLLSREDNQLVQNSVELFYELLLKGLPKNNSVAAHSSRQVHKRYAGIYEAIPYKTKKRIDNISLNLECSLDAIKGLIRSSHLYEIFSEARIEELRKAKPNFTQQDVDDTDLALEFERKFRAMWNIEAVSNDEKLIKVAIDYQLLLARI